MVSDEILNTNLNGLIVLFICLIYDKNKDKTTSLSRTSSILN